MVMVRHMMMVVVVGNVMVMVAVVVVQQVVADEDRGIRLGRRHRLNHRRDQQDHQGGQDQRSLKGKALF
jgi:hypothetical protein